MGCGFSRERKNSASERSYLRRRSSAAACLSVFSGCLLFLPRHPRTASGIPAPVCFVRNRTDAKGSDPPGEVPRHPAVRPVGPPLRLAARLFRPTDRAFRLHPRTAFGIPAPVCSVRFAFSNASRPCGPERPQAPFSGPRIVPSACTAAIFGPGTPEPLSVSRRPSASSGTGRTRKAPTLREKCRGIRRSGRSAHPCGPRHGYSAPPVADGVFSVHRCFSISTNHSGQRHGRRVSLRMNPSTVDPVLSSSPRSFRIS